MYSKRIVISIIVIGCLAHFITCPNTVDNKKQNSKSPASKPPVKAAKQATPTTSPGAVKPRALPPNNNAVPKGKANAKSPTKPAGQPMEPPAAVNNQGQAKNTADNPDGDGEPAEEKPAGRIKRVFRRFNNFRKKICPIRFFTRLIKKGLGSNKKKPADDEEQPTGSGTLINNT